MNILAIDTATSVLSIAAQGAKGIATQTFTSAGHSHAEQLIPLIDSTIAQAGFTANHIDIVLSPEGPGSFTGLRLGYSAAKALQLASNSTFIPIPTLSCIASQYDLWEDGLAAVIDAKRNRFYVQLFKNQEPITPISDSTIEEILPFFSHSKRWLVTGYGTQTFQKALITIGNNNQFCFIETAPMCFAQSMIVYARKNMDTLAKASDYTGPLYIRPVR